MSIAFQCLETVSFYHIATLPPFFFFWALLSLFNSPCKPEVLFWAYLFLSELHQMYLIFSIFCLEILSYNDLCLSGIFLSSHCRKCVDIFLVSFTSFLTTCCSFSGPVQCTWCYGSTQFSVLISLLVNFYDNTVA